MDALYCGEAAIYGLNIDSFLFDENRIGTMPPERARNIRSFRFLDDRRRSFAAGLLLEAALGREAAFRILRRGCGKPYLDGGPCFSVSHSGCWAVLAVCDEEVGLDIEAVRAGRDTGLVARHAFQAEEIEAAAGDPENFYRVWTAKESYLKMKGGGLAGISGLCVQLEDGGARVKDHPETAIRFFRQFDGYVAAVSAPAGIAWPDRVTIFSGIQA